MKNKKLYLFIFLIVLLLAGIAGGVWFYFAYEYPLREARPIIKALRSEDLYELYTQKHTALYLLFIPDGQNHRLTGMAAKKVRQEILNLIQTTEDSIRLHGLLTIIEMATMPPSSWSRIQFEEEDWPIIESAVEKINTEESLKQIKKHNPFFGPWYINEYEGRKHINASKEVH